ncbi:hypothetical protein WMY93_026941 [Mugilogobius chulae]|uniref:protein-tyrosine-phosphatase n=1 Tax=Mugilogobius chulae TaxID=88201 RepID=A0AAW0N1R5_9GOBI
MELWARTVRNILLIQPHGAVGRTVPAAVVSLTAHSRNLSDSLDLSWTRPEGDLSGFSLVLLSPNRSVTSEQEIGPEHTGFTFTRLVPGRKYTAVVTSRSGELSNSATTQARTAPLPPSSLLFAGITNTSLELTWTLPALSDYDDFELRLRTVSGALEREGERSYSRSISTSIRTKPGRVHSLHCRPQSSTSISCSWAPPEADYDSFTVECVLQEAQVLVYSRRTGRESNFYLISSLEPHRRYTITVKVISDRMISEPAQESVVTMIDRPPVPPLSTRVSENAQVSQSSIWFRFNCSWFSDVNGAVRFFTVVVTDVSSVQPEQHHPLASYRDYSSNSSVRSYQTGFFSNMCSEGPDRDLDRGLDRDLDRGLDQEQLLERSTEGFNISLGSGMDLLGGSCSESPEIYCDGPLKPKTAYRISIRAFTQLSQQDSDGAASPLFSDTFLSLPVVTEAVPRSGVVEGIGAENKKSDGGDSDRPQKLEEREAHVCASPRRQRTQTHLQSHKDHEFRGSSGEAAGRLSLPAVRGIRGPEGRGTEPASGHRSAAGKPRKEPLQQHPALRLDAGEAVVHRRRSQLRLHQRQLHPGL